MLHIVTVHHRNDAWIDRQLRQFQRHLTCPYKVWASLEGIPDIHVPKFDVVVPASGDHPGKLNLIAAEIAFREDPSDFLMFLDGDAFLIDNPVPACETLLDQYDLIAIQRPENAGDIQPHPSFAVLRVRTWSELNGDWSMGYQWENESGEKVSDVGGNLLRAIERTGNSWLPLLRSNQREFHPLWFGMYCDMVYHHGAGFRIPFSRNDLISSKMPARWRTGNRIQRWFFSLGFRMLVRRGAKLSASVFALLEEDQDRTIDYLRGEDYMLGDAAFKEKIRNLSRKGSLGVAKNS